MTLVAMVSQMIDLIVDSVLKYPAVRTEGQDHMLCDDISNIPRDSAPKYNPELFKFLKANQRFSKTVSPVTRYHWLQKLDGFLLSLTEPPTEFIVANRERRLQLGILNPDIFKSLSTETYD